MKYSIQASHILLSSEIISGFICIKNEFIKHIIPDTQNLLLNKKLPKYPVKYTFQNQEIIMPGGIDLSCALNPTYLESWDQAVLFTKMAIKGGICMIVNEPYQFDAKSPQATDNDYQMNIYLNSVEELLKKSFVDFSQSTFINCSVMANTCKMLEQGAYIFKSFLSPSVLSDVQIVKDYIEMNEIIHTFNNFEKTVLIVNMQRNIEKDLDISSPYRSQSISSRRSGDSGLKLLTGDGIQGELSSDEEQQIDCQNNVQNNLIEELCNIDIFFLIIFLVQEEKTQNLKDSTFHFSENECNSEKFIKQSKYLTKKIQYQLIAHAELRQYEEKKNQLIPEESKNYKFPDTPQSIEKVYQSPSHSPDSLNSNMKTSNTMIKSHKPSSGVWDQVCTSSDLRQRSKSYSTLLQRRKSTAKTEQFGLQLYQISTKKSDELMEQLNQQFSKDYLCFLAFRPPTWECSAVQLMENTFKYELMKNNNSIILSGFSSSLALSKLHELAKRYPDSKFDIDIPFPYIFMDSSQVKEGSTQFKANPPFRTKEIRNQLQQAVCNFSWVNSLSSGHFFVDPELKFFYEGDFRRAFSGITTIGVNYQAVWTIIWSQIKKTINLPNQAIIELFYNKKNKDITKLIVESLSKIQTLLCEGPAKMLKLSSRGQIKKGFLANLIIWNPFEITSFESTIETHLFNEMKMMGNIKKVFMRGHLCYEQSIENGDIFYKVQPQVVTYLNK